MHVSPLLRVSRNIVEQGPTLPLLAAWGVLAVLIGVLTAKAAGLVFFRNGSRRLSLVTLIVACALFHGEVIVSVDAPKTIAILATAGGTVAVVSLAHRFREHLAGTGPAIADLFPMTLWARLSGEPATNPLCFVGLGASQPRGPPL
jgi:hypothetical protein